MDITNLPPNMIKVLEQKNTEQLLALARLINLTVGKIAIATINETTPVSPQEREALLKQTTEALSLLNKQIKNPAAIPPTLKAEIERLISQQQLIQSPALKWVNLTINNRPLLTYTDKPLSENQTIMVQMATANKLVLLDLPTHEKTTQAPMGTTVETPLEKKSVNAPAIQAMKDTLLVTSKANRNVTTPITTEKNISLSNILKNEKTPENIISSKNATQSILQAFNNNAISRPNDLTPPFQNNNIKKTTADVGVIAEQLRQHLPIQDKPNFFYAAIAQLQQIPKTQQQKFIPQNLEQALKSVAEHIRTPLQLSQPHTLANIIKNSGIFFEGKLNQQINNNQYKNESIKNAEFKNIVQQDLKGTLLQLLHNINKETGILQKHNDLLSALKILSPTSNSNPVIDTGDLPEDLANLLKKLSDKNTQETPTKELRSQLLNLLQQHSIHSLAKIQLQQLHSLNHAIDNKDSAQTTSSWQLEIPVKHQGDVHQIHVKIDRDWIEDKRQASDTKSASTKTKQWSVTLRFDLPTLGEFCAQMTIIDTTVSATLWAAQEHTLSRVRTHMNWLREQLENKGVNVKQIQCLQGIPPLKSIKLSYSLIDVST